MDSELIPEGVQRCSLGKFILWISAWGVVLLIGVYAMILCWVKGLNQTNMNDAYGFALWIWADLAVIALGGGAFFYRVFTLYYRHQGIEKHHQLRSAYRVYLL